MSDSWDAFPEAAPSGGRTITIPGQGGVPTRVIMNMGGDSWDAFPEASKMDTAKDIAKSAGIGVARGTLGLAGAAGDLSNLLAKGSQAATNFIADKAGIDPGPQAGEALLPTSASLQKNVEDVTGDFYKPQTLPGHYAETIGEFAPAAVAGPGGFLRKAALGAIIPGAASEAAGQATVGSPLEPYARAAGGIAGGVGGALLARPGSTAQAIRSQLPEGVTQATIDDARHIMQNSLDRGIHLTWPEAISQAAGRPVLSDTQRILESAPSSRTRMQNFHAERPQQFDQAALNEFGHIAPGTATPSQIGPQAGAAANESLQGVRQQINQAAQPYYDRAAQQLFTPQEFQQIQTIPGYAESLAAVRNNPQINWRVAHLPDNSVGVLNEVKKHFDQAAQNAGSRFNPARNHQVQASNEMGASAARQIGIARSADYEIALAIQQQARQQFLEPLLQGPLGRLAKRDITTQKAIDVLFPSNPLPNSHNEVHTAVSALVARNPGAATQLVRAHVESVFNEASQNLQGGANQFGAAKFANRIVGNVQQRANLQAAIEALPNGHALWNGFDNFLEAAEASGTRQAKGSLTAFNAQELKAMSGSSMVGEAVKTGLSPGKWWSVVSDKWSQWQLGRNLDELARIFTDPHSAPLLRRISNMPRGSREAGYIVSRLMLQAENAAVQPREARRQ